ncbi:MAG: DUF4097 family beta strand repeat protein [Verrucomicrobia bacterium]|nr:DUF4097 family beta strand repeat protein [Verrucomicrobiota bacterium]
MNIPFRFFVSAGLLAATALTAHARIERNVEKTFTVQAAGTLRLETQGGEIRVMPGADGVVKITAREKIRANTDAEADDLLKKLDLDFTQTGNDVTAIAKYERKPIGFNWGSWPPVQVDFIVAVPAAYATELRTSGGGITSGDLNGRVNARTSGGSIKLGRVGADVDAHTSGGNVTLDAARGEVKLGTSGGNITVGRVDGPASLSTSGGSIKVDSVVGALKAHTSGGNIRAGVAGPLKDDCVLSTSGGSVRVTVDKAAAFRLDASTSGGSVDAEGLTITLEKSSRDRSKLAGSVNGGGPLLKLRSSGGSIEVKTL